MRPAIFILAAALLPSSPAQMRAADNATPASPAPPPKPVEQSDPGRHSLTLDQPARPGRFYGGLDYLAWWLKPASLSVPLVSTGPVSTTHHGWLINSDATVLYGAAYPPANGGNNSQAFPVTSGGRLTFGYWLDEDQHFALEVGGFALMNQSAGYEIRSDASGNPIINIPVLNTISYSPTGRPGLPAGSEDGLPASLPDDPNRFDGNSGIFQGGVKIVNTIELWGANVTGVLNLYRNSAWEISGVAGFRYLDLSETFDMTFDSEGVSGNYSGATGVAWDKFETFNHFYGGNFGLRARYEDGPLSVELSLCAAPGLNEEVQEVSGGFQSVFQSTYTSGPEGVFAQPANEGRTSSDRFAVVPELGFKLGYSLTPSVRATLGYDFLYWSNVIRPGDQLNREIPKGQTFQQGHAPDSTTSPTRLFKTTDFYAHGVSFGLEFTF